MMVITLKAVLARWPGDQTLCQADWHTLAARLSAGDVTSLASVSSSAKWDEVVERRQFPRAARGWGCPGQSPGQPGGDRVAATGKEALRCCHVVEPEPTSSPGNLQFQVPWAAAPACQQMPSTGGFCTSPSRQFSLGQGLVFSPDSSLLSRFEMDGLPILFIYFYFYFFGCASRRAGSYFPDQALNLCPLQWKRGVLTTGPPGKSLGCPF